MKGPLVTIACAGIIVVAARFYGRSPLFAFGVNWILIVWAHPSFGVFPLRLPAGYYRTRPFERGGRVYDRLGVRWYRRLLRPMLWSVEPRRLRSGQSAREGMIEATYDPETGHLVIFIVIMGITAWALGNGWWDAVVWLFAFNILHNAYPVLSIRQVRARLTRSRK